MFGSGAARLDKRDLVVPSSLPGTWTSQGCYVYVLLKMVKEGCDADWTKVMLDGHSGAVDILMALR